MITKPTRAQADAVSNPVLLYANSDGTWTVYQVGDAMPAWWVAAQVPLTPAQVLATTSAIVSGSLVSNDPVNEQFKAFILVLLDEINLIRSLLVPSQGARTAAQLKAAIITKINVGLADG
jgi:hypothetical protein